MTVDTCGGIGSQGLALAVVNPALGPIVPLHRVCARRRGPCPLASLVRPTGSITSLDARWRGGLHPCFVAVVEEGCATTGEEDGRDHALNVGVVYAVAVAGIDARIVVVVEDEQRSMAVEGDSSASVSLARNASASMLVDEAQLRIHGQLELRLAGRSVLLLEFTDIRQVSFANEDARAGKLVRVEFVGGCARISAMTGCTPGRLLVRVSLRAMSPYLFK